MRQVPDERYCSFHRPLTLTCPMTDHRPSAQSPRPGVTLIAAAALGATLACGGRDGAAKDSTRVAADSSRATSCTGDNGGLTLPPGFCATIFADSIGHARQHLNLLGFALMVNSLALQQHRRRDQRLAA